MLPRPTPCKSQPISAPIIPVRLNRRLALTLKLRPAMRASHPQVARLQAVVEAQKLQSSFYEQRLQHGLVEERMRSERLREARDEAMRQR